MESKFDKNKEYSDENWAPVVSVTNANFKPGTVFQTYWRNVYNAIYRVVSLSATHYDLEYLNTYKCWVPDHSIHLNEINWTFREFLVKPLKESIKESGHRCHKCKGFNEYAEANQENGTFICYGCRSVFC